MLKLNEYIDAFRNSKKITRRMRLLIYLDSNNIKSTLSVSEKKKNKNSYLMTRGEDNLTFELGEDNFEVSKEERGSFLARNIRARVPKKFYRKRKKFRKWKRKKRIFRKSVGVCYLNMSTSKDPKDPDFFNLSKNYTRNIDLVQDPDNEICSGFVKDQESLMILKSRNKRKIKSQLLGIYRLSFYKKKRKHLNYIHKVKNFTFLLRDLQYKGVEEYYDIVNQEIMHGENVSVVSLDKMIHNNLYQEHNLPYEYDRTNKFVFINILNF